jgi:hypothetical protein
LDEGKPARKNYTFKHTVYIPADIKEFIVELIRKKNDGCESSQVSIRSQSKILTWIKDEFYGFKSENNYKFTNINLQTKKKLLRIAIKEQ